MFGTSLVDPIEDVPYFSHRLKLIPDELKGRVVSACRLLPGMMRPLGLALTGILIQQVGIFPTIWLAWVWLLVSTVIVAILPHVRRERALSSIDRFIMDLFAPQCTRGSERARAQGLNETASRRHRANCAPGSPAIGSCASPLPYHSGFAGTHRTR